MDYDGPFYLEFGPSNQRSHEGTGETVYHSKAVIICPTGSYASFSRGITQLVTRLNLRVCKKAFLIIL